jgi:hypothetical protein
VTPEGDNAVVDGQEQTQLPVLIAAPIYDFIQHGKVWVVSVPARIGRTWQKVIGAPWLKRLQHLGW